MTTENNEFTPRPSNPYNCHFCGAFNNAGCLCGCGASREAAGERTTRRTASEEMEALNSIELVW